MSDARGTPEVNPLELDDEAFGKLNAPTPAALPPAADDTAAGNDADANADADQSGEASDDDAGSKGKADDKADGDAGDGDTGDDDDDTVLATAAAAKATDKLVVKAGTQGAKDDQAPTGDEGKGDKAADTDGKPAPAASSFVAPSNEDAQKLFMQVMTPFKANGKTIALKNPEEAIQLMQMGANYTRKMQDLQPHRKMLMMLQTNNLDETKLSYLIDLDQKNPEAIKKLIKDSGIDPLDIDTTEDSGYKPGLHELTDGEVSFRTTLDDLSQTSSGQETIIEVNNKFDDVSKEAVWQSPEIMSVLHSQRENGVYAIITEEMDRQITLGTIPPNTPFLEAYKIVGDQLSAQVTATGSSGQEPGSRTGQAGKPAPVVVDTRVAAPRSKVANGDKAEAAAGTRSTPSSKSPVVNPLSLSDDEFMKQMAGRV